MSRLLVVLSHGALLQGVVADEQRLEAGDRVFYRDGAEVARAGAGQPVVVRRTDPAVAGTCPPQQRRTSSLTGTAR